MLAKRILIILGIAMVLGCSGSTSLIVQNLTGKPISGTVKIQTSYGKELTVRTSDFSLAEGEDAETVSWFVNGPDWLDIEYSLPNEKPIRKRLLPREYPPGMEVGTSAGAWYFLEARETGLALRGPTGWEKFQRNPQTYFLIYGGWACCGLTVVAMFWIPLRYVRKRWPPTPPPTGQNATDEPSRPGS